MKNTDGQVIFVELGEHEAALRELKMGWYMMDCQGDEQLKGLYLEQGLTVDDMLAWRDGVVTDRFWELLNDIGGADANDVIVKYSREHRRYEIEVVERIAAILPEPNIVIRATNLVPIILFEIINR